MTTTTTLQREVDALLAGLTGPPRCETIMVAFWCNIMPSLTIKQISAELLARLRARASQDGRSLNKEVIHLLERALSALVTLDDGLQQASEAQRQADAWSRLAGRWESDRTAAQEIKELRAARTTGRSVKL